MRKPPATTGSMSAPTSAVLRKRGIWFSSVTLSLNDNPIANGPRKSSGIPYNRSDGSARFDDSPPYRSHRVFQDSATPERNRFFVRRNPSGEIEIVNGSPSISISRRIVLSSLVDMIQM